MVIMVIDDESSMVRFLSSILERLGYVVRPFTDPLRAMTQLDSDVELVISDIKMPGLDGFAVAEQVDTLLGSLPPKTLLISGISHGERLDEYPPSMVIGLLLKPIALANLRSVVELIARSRKRCPGVESGFCAHACMGSAPCHDRKNGDVLCETPNYAACPYYDTLCGKALRRWISRISSAG